jgi:hypothetical protein
MLAYLLPYFIFNISTKSKLFLPIIQISSYRKTLIVSTNFYFCIVVHYGSLSLYIINLTLLPISFLCFLLVPFFAILLYFSPKRRLLISGGWGACFPGMYTKQRTVVVFRISVRLFPPLQILNFVLNSQCCGAVCFRADSGSNYS